MKKSKLLIGAVSLAFVGTLVTGCDNSKTRSNVKDNKTTKTEEKNKLKAKCSAIECIKKINVETTVEEVNKIIGVDGVLTDEKYNFYEYDLGNDEKITLKFYSSQKPTIIADFDKDDIADKKVDLSKLTELKSKVRSGITYDEFKAELGNTDGVLIEKSDSSNRYMWVSKKGGYVKATFRTSDNKCTFFSGYGDTK
ncbi:MAG: hypothetical protein J6B89_02680 [Bacilli bacterium]|nr:hypothetical protein [Bacilli bacterium]